MPGNTAQSERTPLLGQNRTQDPERDQQNFNFWRQLVLTLLVIAYTGYYYSKTNFSLIIPILEEDEGISRTGINAILTSGYIFYLSGKFLSGFIVDKVGGRMTLMGGLAGSIICSTLFPLKKSTVWFAIFRSANQLFSSVGWAGCIKTVRGWYPPSKAAHATAIASLGETLGDAIVRVTLGASLINGFSWQQMFYLSAVISAVILIPSYFIAVPAEKGFENPEEKDQDATDAMESRSVYNNEEGAVAPLVKNARVWLLSLQIFGVLLVRESFASFVSTFIQSALDLSTGYSSLSSAIFPAMGAVSAIGGGIILDRTRQNRRGLIPFLSLGLLSVALVGLWAVTPSNVDADDGDGPSPKEMGLVLFMVGLTSLFLYAPKVIVDGPFVMDLAGGPQHVGTVTAFATGFGQLGSCVSPFVSGGLADSFGWPVSILTMAGIAAVVTGASGVYWCLDLQALRQRSRTSQA
ncbi:hypothetical protein HDU85_004761 [Gaertneriomyces sp. JEL0708]|nr:hypothetical protein HDU85_004761 [Gaertneriomyces sp. JEL0708]